MKKEIKLMGCPWCGKCPTLGKMGENIVAIECTAFEECTIRPNMIADTIDNAVTLWNNRINLKDEIKYTVVLTID